jgi:hypothetical protein
MRSMIKNPFLNAALAALYIVVLVAVMGNTERFVGDTQTLLIPMVMLSLFVFSAAIMGFLFVYTPATLLVENRKDEALAFFFKTVGTFACFVAAFALLVLLR